MGQSINVTNNDITLALDTIYDAVLPSCFVNKQSALAYKLGAYLTVNDVTHYVSLDNTAKPAAHIRLSINANNPFIILVYPPRALSITQH